MNINQFTPHKDRILVKPASVEQKTSGGILLSGKMEAPVTGTVVVPPEYEVLPSGEVRGATICVGDTVLFGKLVGTQISIGGENYLVMREDDILGKVK